MVKAERQRSTPLGRTGQVSLCYWDDTQYQCRTTDSSRTSQVPSLLGKARRVR
jgi:hypothetical protein